MTARSSARNTPLNGLDAFRVLAGLSALGIAQPLLDLLGRNPEFLVVHYLTIRDLVFLVVLLTIGPAIVLGLMVWISGLISDRWGRWVLGGATAVLLAILVAPVVNRLLPLPGLVTVTATGIGAFLAVWKLGQSPRLRPAWNLLGLVPLLVAGLFFFQPGPRTIMFSRNVESVVGDREQSPPRADTPVVMIVFDAFPTYSIMKQDHGIDDALCPNLASLNDDGVWYRNALSVSDNTLLAVPAILTGLHPLPGQQPTVVSHPNNLLSWLKPWRRVHSLESHTQLDAAGVRPGFGARWRLTASDLWIVFLHSVLPGDLAADLPSITHDWRDFARNGSPGSQSARIPRRMKLFDEFLAAISSGGKGDCYFLHSLVPHTPYQFLPSGRRYSTDGKEPSGEGMMFGKWSQDRQAVVHSQQRFLNQVGYADHLVGRIVNQLRDAGLYEDALIIITADHGMSFSPGGNRRELSPTNRGDILPVPLFVKYPGTGSGAIDDRVVLTVDIMPTIASVLDSPLPWPTDGHDLLDPSYEGHDVTRYLGAASKRKSLEMQTGEILTQRDASILTKEQRFPRIQGRMAMSAPFRGSGLIGTRVPVDLPGTDQWSLNIGGGSRRGFPDSPDDIVAAEVQGLITGETDLPSQWDIAVLVDRRIAAFTRPFSGARHSDAGIWSTLLPEEFLSPGEHVLEAVLVDWSRDTPVFLAPGHQEISALGKNLVLDTVFVSGTSGLHKMSSWGGMPGVWTNGVATFDLELPDTDVPAAVKLSVLAAAPGNPVLIAFANGTLLGARHPRNFPWTGWFDLTRADFGRRLRLSVYSSTYVPAETDSGSRDRRTLGLALSLVELQGNDTRIHEGSEPPTDPEDPFILVLTPGESDGVAWTPVYDTQSWARGRATWTEGHSTCRATWPRPEPPRFLMVEIAGTGPGGTPLNITINGTEVVAEDHVGGNWVRFIDLARVPAAEELEISVISETFVPAEVEEKSQDHRVLGVALRHVILVE